MIIILWLIDITIISKGFWYKENLDSHKGKPRSVIRRGLMRYHLPTWTVLNCFTHTSPMTDPEFILFCFPKLLGAQFCMGSQVVGIYRYLKSWSRRLQDHIAIVYFLCVVSVVLDDDMYIQLQSFISKICYLLYVVRSAVRFVLLWCCVLLLLF